MTTLMMCKINDTQLKYTCTTSQHL